MSISTIDPSRDQLAACLKQVLASAEFTGSAQLSRFLSYIVENEAEPARLKESVIGVAVFNRGASYDPKVDPIVRVEARRLRARLDEYYQNSGLRDPVRISLPKGGYSPSFELADIETQPAPVAAPIPAAPLKRPRRFMAIAIVFSVLAAAVGAMIYIANEPERTISNFWSPILQGDRPALIIPADSGLVMLQDLAHQPVSLQEYITGDYRTKLAAQSVLSPDLASNLSVRRYTSIADLEFASRLMRRPEAQPRGMLTRYARDVRVEDLKGTNLVLVGARHSNPWVELSEKDATFRLEHDERTGIFQVVNVKPQAGEPESIVISPADLPKEIYAIITYHRNRVGSGSALAVAGTSVAGTEAAADFLLDDSRMLPWLRKAASGGEIKGFDILLRDRNLAGSAPRADVVAFHAQK